MEDLTDVYNELIMEHSMNSYNKKKLENADYCEIGHNPNCGDEITLELKLNGDVIEDMAFSGHGCAISQASTSIMIDTLIGKTIDEVINIYTNFSNMIDEKEYNEEVYGEDNELDFYIEKEELEEDFVEKEGREFLKVHQDNNME